MSCGIPQFFSLLWSIRDTVRGDSVDEGLTTRYTTNTATITRDTTNSESDRRIEGHSWSQSQGQTQDHSQTRFENTSQTTQTTTAQSEFAGEKHIDTNTPSPPHPSSISALLPHPTMSSNPSPPDDNNAYATLLTRPSYLPGVVILAHTLKKQKSKYPLVVLVTPGLPQECVEVVQNVGKGLRFEDGRDRVLVWRVELLLPEKWQMPESLIAARFEDTWTKLRVFELTTYTAVCFLDADIALFGDIDSIFPLTSTILPDKSYLAATHACVCNLDRDSWADADWTASNCAYTPQTHPSSLTSGPPVPLSTSSSPHLSTHTLLNGGVFVFYPTPALWDRMLQTFRTSDKLRDMKFPDQDFLAEFFRDKWRTVPWRFNALKTMRYWHENLWVRDEDVVALHYIVDKPWARRVGSDGVAGHLGRDGVTHGWWWKLWEEWREGVRGSEEEGQVMRVLEGLVVGELDGERAARQVGENRREGLPVPVPAH